MRYLFGTGGLNCPLPWLEGLIEDVRRLMGPDPFAYGVEANRRVLATGGRYAWEQGLAERVMEPGELYCPKDHGPLQDLGTQSNRTSGQETRGRKPS